MLFELKDVSRCLIHVLWLHYDLMLLFNHDYGFTDLIKQRADRLLVELVQATLNEIRLYHTQVHVIGRDN